MTLVAKISMLRNVTLSTEIPFALGSKNHPKAYHFHHPSNNAFSSATANLIQQTIVDESRRSASAATRRSVFDTFTRLAKGIRLQVPVCQKSLISPSSASSKFSRPICICNIRIKCWNTHTRGSPVKVKYSCELTHEDLVFQSSQQLANKLLRRFQITTISIYTSLQCSNFLQWHETLPV